MTTKAIFTEQDRADSVEYAMSCGHDTCDCNNAFIAGMLKERAKGEYARGIEDAAKVAEKKVVEIENNRYLAGELIASMIRKLAKEGA